MKKVFAIIVVVLILGAGAFVGTKLLHTCDDCDKFFVGTGYEPNVIAEFVSEDNEIICEDCAEIQHALSLLTGKTLDDFKKDFF